MTGQVAPEHAFHDLQPTLNSRANAIAHDPCFSKRFSDLLVRVEHDSKGGTHGSWWQVLSEGGSDETVVSVAGSDLAPDAFVVDSGLLVPALVDVRDTLAMVPSRIRALGNTLNLDKSLGGVLGSL